MADSMLKRHELTLNFSPTTRADGHGHWSTEDLIASGQSMIAKHEDELKCFVNSIPFEPVDGFVSLPLQGLPVGIKDIIGTAAMPTEYGSPIYSEFQTLSDAAIVALVKRAGGQVSHKTVTTEFAFLNPNKTRNPFDPMHTPGGSSSGSAAAVAAGMLPFAVGTQTGGSVIRPAAYCGVFGFKPSFDALPISGTKTFSRTLDTLGLFAATLDDLCLFWRALISDPVGDPVGESPTVGVIKPFNWKDASVETHQAIDQAASQWAGAGFQVQEVAWPDLFTDAFVAHEVIQNYEACRALGWEMDNHSDRLSPMLLAVLQSGLEVQRSEYLAAQKIATDAREKLTELQSSFDILLTPSAPGTAPKGLGSTGVSTFNRFWTLAGVPCIHFPAYVSESGLPIGVQLVGRFGQDDQFLEHARQLWAAL